MRIQVSDIPVEIVKKNIKNMHLAVLPPDGKVRVSAPLSMPDESIAMFVRTKLGWIRVQQEKFQSQPRQSEREYVSGETFYVWGRQYYLQVEYGNKGNHLELSGNKAILTVRKQSTAKSTRTPSCSAFSGNFSKKLFSIPGFITSSTISSTELFVSIISSILTFPYSSLLFSPSYSFPFLLPAPLL